MKYRYTIFFILFFAANTPVFAQQRIQLYDNWQFLKQDIGGIWEAVRPIKKSDDPEAVPAWTNVTLPHCVNADDAVDPDVAYYQGPAWYKTQLTIHNPYEKGRTLLHFEGAGQKSVVYVYTTKVGAHVGGYDEWAVDITEAVEAFKKTDVYQKQFKGKIPISIRTDNSRDLEMIPSSLSDFNIYGGIYRPLQLVYTPALSIDKLFISSVVDQKGTVGKVSIRARWYDPSNAASASILVKLRNDKGKLLQQFTKQLNSFNGDALINEFTIRSPKLWSPQTPVLYSVEAMLISGKDTCSKTEKTGFRNIELVKKGPLFLNGKRLLLQGTHRHEDHAGVAAAMTDDMIRAEMLLIKEMGVNFIRLGHYQQSRYVLDLCDSLGILVWEEIPWCRGGLGGDIYKNQARRMLTNMIEQHYDHPSVIIWGLGNENDWPNDFPIMDTAAIKNFMSELNELSHRLDPSRKTAIRRCDFCKDIPDIYSPSIWAGWYRGNYTEYKDISKKEFDRVDHFLHVEWGGDSHAKRHSEKTETALQQFIHDKDTAVFVRSITGAKDGDWNENYICNLIDWHLKEQLTMPWLTGTAQWAFKDFSTAIRPDNPVPYINQKGVVERDLTKKESYYVFQSYWSTKPMVHIYGHSMPVRWGSEGGKKLVKVYSNADRAELFVNGKSVGIKNRDTKIYPASGLYWEVVFAKGDNTIEAVSNKNKMVLRDTVHLNYQTEQWGKPAKLIIENSTVANGIATINVKLVDDQNRQCLDATNRIRFGLTGDGKLIDNQGTSTGSRYIQLYNGAACIRLQTNNGKSVVSAAVEGVKTVFIDL